MTYTVLWDPERAVKNTMGLNKEGNNKKHFYLVEKKNLLLNGHDLTEPICSYQDYNIKPVWGSDVNLHIPKYLQQRWGQQPGKFVDLV